MDTKKLRQKILDLAIHGKLVPQDPNDEPASVLLERIRAEKERLVKEGKIKKSKTSKTSDTPHYENRQVGEANVPFEVPSSWEWTTLGEFFTLQAGKNITAKDISDKQNSKHRFPCYGGNGLRGYVDSYNRNGRFPLIGRQGALCGNINEANGQFYATEHAVVVDTYCKTDIDWAIYTLLFLNLNQYATSTAQPGLSVSTINEVMIPVPPIVEQFRISKEIAKWFNLIDLIEQGKADLQTAIKQAKSKILDLAIHGKLVPQDPTDEPASALLKRINPKAEITCDNGQYQNMPFELPNTWVCCRLGDVISIKSGDSISVRNNRKGEYPIYGGNGINGYFCDYNVESDTIVIGRVGFYCGSVYKTKSRAWVTDNAFIVCYKNIFNSTYLKHLLEWLQLSKTSNSTAQPVISGKGIYPILIPLPPLAEQQRIVDAIDKAFAKLDAIMESL